MSGGANECRDCANIGAACATGGLCFDGKSRCPRFEDAFQYDEEFSLFSAAIHPANWTQSGMGPPALNLGAVMTELSHAAPEASPTLALRLAKSAALGLTQGLSVKSTGGAG